MAQYLCNRIGVMFFGLLVEVGGTEDVFAKLRPPYSKARLTALDDDGCDPAALEPPALSGSGCRYHGRR